MMKKNIIYALILVLTLALVTACGSNSKENPPTPEGPYKLTNLTTPFTIGYAGEQKEFQVQVLKDGNPISGETVSVGFLPASFGFLDSATAISNDSGYAVFKYTAADSLTNGTQSLELIHKSIEDGSITTAELIINLTFAPK